MYSYVYHPRCCSYQVLPALELVGSKTPVPAATSSGDTVAMPDRAPVSDSFVVGGISFRLFRLDLLGCGNY